MRHADLLERLLEGDALPQDSRIGEDVPEELDRLAMLADLVSHAAEPDPVEMRAEARSDLRTTLIREANLRAAEPPPLLTRIRETVTATTERWAYSSRAAVAGGTAAMVLSTGGVAAAANGSLPGDLFYDLKLAAEDMALSFADAGVSRGEGLLQQATTRVEEVHTAAERQQEAAAAAGLRLADEHTRDGAQEYLATYLDTGDTEVLQVLGDWVVTTNRRLDLLPPVDGDAAAALADLRTSLNRIGQRIEVLATGACTSCALGVHDNPAADPSITRGNQADGTPPTPASQSPLDLTFIPPADQPFQACPCVPAAPPGAATPPPGTPAPTGSTPPPEESEVPGTGGTPPTRDPEPEPEPEPEPAPFPMPDTGPVEEQVPDPVREAIEELSDGLPEDPGTAPSSAPMGLEDLPGS